MENLELEIKVKKLASFLEASGWFVTVRQRNQRYLSILIKDSVLTSKLLNMISKSLGKKYAFDIHLTNNIFDIVIYEN